MRYNKPFDANFYNLLFPAALTLAHLSLAAALILALAEAVIFFLPFLTGFTALILAHLVF